MIYSPVQIELLANRLDRDELAFYREHLTPMRRADGRRMVEHWSTGLSDMAINGEPVLLATHYYQCDRYDAVAKRCTDYEHRPDVCRGYPWYGDGPDPNKVLPPTCAYRADVGLPVEGADGLEVAVAAPKVKRGRGRRVNEPRI